MGYSFKSSYQWTSGGTSDSRSIDIGTAAADRLVIVATACQAGSSTPTVTVNGVTLTQQALFNDSGGFGASVAFFSGIVSSGSGPQTVLIDWSGANFTARGAAIWVANGLNTTPPKVSGTHRVNGDDVTLNVAAGDFVFAYIITLSTTNFDSSTDTPPAREDSAASGGFVFSSADWTAGTTSASWHLNANQDGDEAYVTWAPLSGDTLLVQQMWMM